MADFEKVYSIKFETRRAQSAVNKLNKSVEKIQKETVTAGKKFEKHVGKDATRAINKLNKRVRVATVSLAQMRAGLDKLSRKLAVVSGAFIALGGVSVRNILKLNEGMANVSTLLTGGTEQVNQLKAAVQDMAKETGKGTSDLAEGLYEVVSALGENTKNMDQLQVAARAAIAGRSSTLGAVKMLSAVTKGYGDTSDEAMKKVSDLAFMTVKLGQTTFPELASSIGRVVPLAAAMNTSQEELFGTMATLTGVTGDTAEVSTQLASVYSAFLKPTEAMTKAAKKYGFESGAAMLKSVGFRQALINLNDAVDGNETKLAKLLKRKEGLIAALALLGGQSDTYEQKLGEMTKASGATDDAYRKQTEGINKQGHEWEKTKQRMIVFSQQLGEKLLPVLGRLMTRLEPILEYLEQMDEEAVDAWIAFAKWVTILAIATKALSGFLGVVQTLGTMRSLTTGLSATQTGLAGVATKATAASRALMGVHLAGALVAGLALGSMLHETVLDPQAKRREKKRERVEHYGRTARDVARFGTREEKEARIAQMEREQTRMRKEAGGASVEDFAGALAATFTFGAVESPAQQRRRAYQKSEAGIKQLKESIKTDLAEEFFRGAGGPEYQVTAPPAAPTQSINVMKYDLTVNAPTGESEAIKRVLKRELSNHERKVLEDLKRATRGTTPSER